MSETPTMAALTLANPDEGLTKVLEELPRLSAANESESQQVRRFEDGSGYILRSRMGGEVVVNVFSNDEEANAPLPPLADPE